MICDPHEVQGLSPSNKCEPLTHRKVVLVVTLVYVPFTEKVDQTQGKDLT
jgi:hypothetical protein